MTTHLTLLGAKINGTNCYGRGELQEIKSGLTGEVAAYTLMRSAAFFEVCHGSSLRIGVWELGFPH